jgi:hypothetical protein
MQYNFEDEIYNYGNAQTIEIFKKTTQETMFNVYNSCFFLLAMFFIIENNNNIRNGLYLLFTMLQNKLQKKINNIFEYYFNQKSDEISVSYSELEKSVIKYEDKYKEKYIVLEEKEILKERLDDLKNSIIMENTPLGNVIMFYDNKRETFTYFSDNSIPYRFLETVARKYVVLHDCKGIFVDMDEELKNAQKRLEEKKQKIIDQKEKIKMQMKLNEGKTVTRNVFAKLKSYNNDNGLKVAGISGEAKNTTGKKNTEENNENMILKENANRYSCEGKIINFSFLKKVDRKVVDKKYGMSFAEFKRRQINS